MTREKNKNKNKSTKSMACLSLKALVVKRCQF